MANRSHSCALQLVRDFSVCDTLHDPRVTCGVGKVLQVAAADSSLWRAQRRQPAGPGIQRGSSLQSGIRYSAYRTFLREGSGACSLEHFLLLCASCFSSTCILLRHSIIQYLAARKQGESSKSHYRMYRNPSNAMAYL